MISGLMQRYEHLLLERGQYNDTSRDSALVTVFQQIVFYDQLQPDIGKTN